MLTKLLSRLVKFVIRQVLAIGILTFNEMFSNLSIEINPTS